MDYNNFFFPQKNYRGASRQEILYLRGPHSCTLKTYYPTVDVSIYRYPFKSGPVTVWNVFKNRGVAESPRWSLSTWLATHPRFPHNFSPAGMSTPCSRPMPVYKCHPIARKFFPKQLAEVDTVAISVTNESTLPSFNDATLLIIFVCYFKNKIHIS